MATSSVEIANQALIICGADTITSLSSTGTKPQRLCNELYDKIRDQLLISHPWNFAIGRIEIAADADLPANWEDDKWSYAFTLASDVLRVISIDSEEEWAIENGKLFTTYAPVKIKYIKKETDTTKFSKNFEEALAYALAHAMSYSLTESATVRTQIKEEAELSLKRARSYDAQENSIEVYEISDFLNSRG